MQEFSRLPCSSVTPAWRGASRHLVRVLKNLQIPSTARIYVHTCIRFKLLPNRVSALGMDRVKCEWMGSEERPDGPKQKVENQQKQVFEGPRREDAF